MPTFQDALAALADADAPDRGLRFCFGREANDQAGVFRPWPQVLRRIDGLARRLQAMGTSGGDTVIAVHSHDQETALVALLAAMRLGAVPTALAPVGTGSPERLVAQFRAILAVSGARLLVCDKPLPDDLAADLPCPVLVVEALDEADPPEGCRRAGADDPCFLQFTSGSTATPKGVVVTHRMLLANLAAMRAVIGWDEGGRCVGWLPIYHDMSLVGMYLMIVAAAARGCFFPTTRFGRSPDLWLRLIAEERAHFSAGPNFAFAMVARIHERRPITGIDLSSLKGIICGSEPIAAEAMRRFAAITAPLGCPRPVIPAYGMAECTLMATSAGCGEDLVTVRADRRALEAESRFAATAAEGAVELVGCGGPAPGMAVAIDAGGTLIGEDRVGEVLLAGDSVLDRYWNNAAATEAAFVIHAGSRWYRTGDLGFVHDGHTYICGRAKDLIIHNGVNHYPADVEDALVRDLGDDIRLAAIVDLRRDLAEDFRGLGVLGEAGRKPDEGSRERIATFVKAWTDLPVACVHLLPPGEHLPRTTSGKLVRGAIRERLWELG